MYESCLNCGGLSFKEKYYIKQFDRSIAVCMKCGLVQVNPRKSMLNIVDHEDVSVRNRKLSKLLSLMEKGRVQKIKEIMKKETVLKTDYFRSKIRDIYKYKSSGRLLDIGSAQGAFLSALSESDFKLYGVEPSKYTYAESLKYAPDSTIYNCTIFESQFSKDSFDVVTVINTLEHLLNPIGTIKEVHRILKPSGLLMIETPNIDHWIPKLFGRRWIQLLVPDHVVFFSKKILKDILENTGFDVKEVKFSYKTMSIRLFLFHLNRYLIFFSNALIKIIEKIDLADKTISLPQRDEMVLFATKNRM